MKNISAAILAGGFGTRLRPTVGDDPKVLAQVQSQPFIRILLDQLESAGMKKAVLLTGYRASQIRQTLGDRHGGMALEFSTEPGPLGTAGALRLALPYLEADSILLLNGDSYCDIDLALLVSQHAHRRADLSMTLAYVDDANRFGQVDIAQDGRLTRFAEKCESNSPGWINAGVYVLSRALVQAIPSGRAVSLEKELLPNWVQHRRVFGCPTAGRFLDIGTPSSYAKAAAFFSSMKFGTSDSNDRPPACISHGAERSHYAVS